MAISEEQKEEVKARVDIVDLVASYGHQIEYKGGKPWVKCPFHTEKTASCQLNPSEGRYHCFGCGVSGDVIKFVMEMEGLSFMEALRKLADKVGVELKENQNPMAARCKRLKSLMAELAIDFNKMLKATAFTEADIARQYLKERHLDSKTVDDFLIGYVPKDVNKLLAWASKKGYTEQEMYAAGVLKQSTHADGKPYSYFGGRLLFTIRNKNGEAVAFSGRLLEEGKKGVGKYVNSPETIIFKKARTFFAFDKARSAIVKAPNREAIICEGQIDCIRLHVNGFNNAVAPLGTAFTEDHAALLKKVADSALLVFDDDAAGHKATIRTAALLLAQDMPVRVVSLPDGDDPDSFLCKKRAKAFAELINTQSESIVKFQIRAERGKEQDPTSPNATVRITKAVLETISHCRSKVMRDSLAKEAAQLLGLPQGSLYDELSRLVKEVEPERMEDANKPIEQPKSARAEDFAYVPSNAESVLIGYLVATEKKPIAEEIREAVRLLVPPHVLQSAFARKFLEAYLKPSTGDDDNIRDLLESAPLDEYRYFISVMTTTDALDGIDGPKTKEIRPKDKILYVARQIWHDYLLRMLKRAIEVSPKESPSAFCKEICQKVKELHTTTPKGLVKFIREFPHKHFEVLFQPKDQKPNGQEQPPQP